MIRPIKYFCLKQFGLLFIAILFMSGTSVAQRISFGAYTTSRGLTLIVSGGLDFGDNIITNSPPITIGLNDNCAYVEIDGDAARDITIVVPSSANLTHAADQIPFACQFAYCNTGAPDAITGKLSAVEISPGVTFITIPMLQRGSGTPAPPPTPAHGTYTAPKAAVYLYLYGTVGPVGSVSAGQYTGLINVYVNYTTY